MGLSGMGDSISGNGKAIVLTSLVMTIVFIAVSALMFFISLKSPEQVMVPNVVGKDLPEGLIELQAKELYPRIQLRYSEKAEERGRILEQAPAAGAIVKGGKRIELVVSQGTVIDTVQNYIGEHIEDVQERIQELFNSGTRQYVRIRQPYLVQYSSEPAGTILEQEPPMGTPISNNMELTFVISKGIEQEQTKVPDMVNAGLEKIYQIMQKASVVFDFTASDSIAAGRIIVDSQSHAPQSSIPVFSAVTLSLSLPERTAEGIISGILKTELTEFPYPFTVSLYAAYQNGDKEQLTSFRHPGGACSVPYAVPEGTVLSLEVLNKEVYTETAGQ
ncbi:MAG: PASTA domain-containing protein [Treponema sp.]